MHLTAPEQGLIGTVPIVGATIPMAVGAAWAAKRRSGSNVAVAFFGDGATEEGVFHESCNLANALGAPVVFVCENNLFSSHLAIGLRQPYDSVSRYGAVHGLHVRTVDGNNVVQVEEASAELIALARKGEPGLLEAVTFRWRGHVGPREDVDVGVGRSMVELSAWKERDCIARFFDACVDAAILDNEALARVEKREGEKIEASLQRARTAPYPSVDRMFEVVYATGEPGERS
jgi:pyruvate dehydrogenase E1 component alpha subunit